MRLLDRLNKKYNQNAKTIPDLIARLNSLGLFSSKGTIEFLSVVLEEIDTLLVDKKTK